MPTEFDKARDAAGAEPLVLVSHEGAVSLGGMISEVKTADLPWRWSVTASALTGKPHEYVCEVLRRAGWDGLEGHMHLFPEGTGSPETIRQSYADAGLRIATFHIPYTPADDLAAFDEGERKEAVARALHAMEFACALGARVGVVHPTVSRRSIEAEGFDTFMRPLERSLAELLPRAQSLGFTLAVENMCPRPPGTRFGSKPEHFERFAFAFGHPHLGFCYDTGHALMSMHGHALEVLDAMGSRLIAVHLADNAGDRDSHLAPGRGLVDWTGVFRAMRASGFTGYACVETPPFAYGPEYSLEAWQAHLAGVRQLAVAALG